MCHVGRTPAMQVATMKMPICAVLLGAAHAAAFATGGACVDMKPALLKKFFEDAIANAPEEQQMQVVEAKIPGTCEEVKAAEGCKFVTKECCATCGDVAPDIRSPRWGPIGIINWIFCVLPPGVLFCLPG